VDPYQGFDEFVTSHTAVLSRVAFLLTGDHHLAEDLLQVALSQVASRWPQVRDGNPEAYVRRCLVNQLTSWRRRRRYHERPIRGLACAKDGLT
jgi:DNA-directed RNA polymerase specialized sigma24 family protein